LNIIALTDENTAVGLRLAGITTLYVPNEEKTALQHWHDIEDAIEDIGLIIITEEIAETIEKELSEFRIRHVMPIVIEIPDKQGRKTDHEDYISQLIKKAVGIQVEKK
jgi:V/A-type H+-transporting ATPase subunit F